MDASRLQELDEDCLDEIAEAFETLKQYEEFYSHEGFDYRVELSEIYAEKQRRIQWKADE